MYAVSPGAWTSWTDSEMCRQVRLSRVLHLVGSVDDAGGDAAVGEAAEVDAVDVVVGEVAVELAPEPGVVG
jgi:hypothetical protein